MSSANGINDKVAFKAFEGKELDISSMYSTIISTMWIACFYSPIVPLIMPLSAVSILL